MRLHNMDQTKIPKWTILQPISKFHDLNLYNIIQTNGASLSIFLVLQSLQMMSLISFSISDNSKRSNAHKEYFETFLPSISATGFIKDIRFITLIVLNLWIMFRLVLFIYIYQQGVKDPIYKQQNKMTTQILHFLNFIDVTCFLIPCLHIIFSTYLGGIQDFYYTEKVVIHGEHGDVTVDVISKEQIDPKYNVIFIVCLILSFSLFLLFILIFLKFVLLNYDFHYLKKNKYASRDQRIFFMDLCFIVLIIFLKHLPSAIGDRPFTGKRDEAGNFPETKESNKPIKIIQNIACIIYGISGIFQMHSSLVFMGSSKVRFVKYFTYLVLLYEGICALITQLNDNFNMRVDLDYMFIILCLVLVKVCYMFTDRKRHLLRNMRLQQIKSQTTAELYMKEYIMTYRGRNIPKMRMNLFSMLHNHISKCNKVNCLCKIGKFYYSTNLNGRTIEEEIHRISIYKTWIKVVLYDKESHLQEIIKEHGESFFQDQQSGNFAINLDSSNILQIFSYFFHTLSEQIQGNIFNYMASYISFLIYEFGNCIGALITAYNYIYSHNYQHNSNMYQHVIMQNFIGLGQTLLNLKFMESDYKLSREHFNRVYEFQKSISGMRDRLYHLYQLKLDFFTEFSNNKINFKNMIDLGDQIMKRQGELEKNLESMMSTSMSNSELIYLFIQFRKTISFDNNFELAEQIAKYYEQISKDLNLELLTEKMKTERNIDLFSRNNMTVFVNIYKSKFTIAKFSSSFSEFFGYSSQELKGLDIENLMPSQIAKNHSEYVVNFLNRRKGTRLRVPHFTAFAVDKFGELKVVGLAIKLEYFMMNDIYLCAIINSHPRNNQNLLLTEFNGKVSALNQKGLISFGESIFLSNYSIFFRMPSLLKYYYPKLTRYLNYKRISGRRKYSKVVDMNNDAMLEDEIAQKNARGRKKAKSNMTITSVDISSYMFRDISNSGEETDRSHEGKR